MRSAWSHVALPREWSEEQTAGIEGTGALRKLALSGTCSGKPPYNEMRGKDRLCNPQSS